MSKRRTTQYEHGERFQVYINRTVDDELLSFINKQSDISGASMLGLILLYQLYGSNDISDLLPRNYRVNAHIPNFNNTVQGNISSQQVFLNPPVLPSMNPITNLEVTERVEKISTRSDDNDNKEVNDSLGDSKTHMVKEPIKDIPPSPAQNEEVTDSKGQTSESKGNGLKSINTTSMLAFAQMSHAKNKKEK